MTRDHFIRLMNLRHSLIEATKGEEMFWLGEHLLETLKRETGLTGYEHPAYCAYCGDTEIRRIENGNPYCGNPKCDHGMFWGEKPAGLRPACPSRSRALTSSAAGAAPTPLSE